MALNSLTDIEDESDDFELVKEGKCIKVGYRLTAAAATSDEKFIKGVVKERTTTSLNIESEEKGSFILKIDQLGVGLYTQNGKLGPVTQTYQIHPSEVTL